MDLILEVEHPNFVVIVEFHGFEEIIEKHENLAPQKLRAINGGMYHITIIIIILCSIDLVDFYITYTCTTSLTCCKLHNWSL